MKNNLLLLALSGLLIANLSVRADNLYDTFETGEDTSNWGASWTGGTTTNTFLDSSFGGQLAGIGTSSGQSFSRAFKNNTAGINLSQTYYMSMFIQLNTFDGPSGGQFEVVDGDFGSGNAGDIRVTTTATPNVFTWQARDQNSGWQNLGLNMSLGSPYQVLISVDPADFTYSATVNSVDSDGNILSTATLSNLAFDQNVINNHQNGTLLYYIQASSGGTEAIVDNITISSMPISTTATPEPSSIALAAGGLATIVFLKNRVARRRNARCLSKEKHVSYCG